MGYEVEHLNLDGVEAVVVVDTFSTGAVLASHLYKRNIKVVCVLSGDLKGLLDLIPSGLELEFAATIVYDTNIDPEEAMNGVLAAVKRLPYTISAVIAGAETGVEIADRLSERMNLRTNGTKHTEARRNKYAMGETVRAAGIRAVEQLQAKDWEEASHWIEKFNPQPFRLVLKPVESAGSDGVTLVNSLDEAKTVFHRLLNSMNSLGVVNSTVLLQEYLEGDEYVIDTVSRNGVHKVAAVWVYDRRKVNGAGFVCFGQRMLTADEPHVKELIEYQKKVITALGIENGPTHGEVKWCRGEPVLIEVGARCHGAEGSWAELCQRVYGYSQVYASIAAYLDEKAFEELPNEPLSRHGFGRLVFFILQEEGLLDHISSEGESELRNMSSFVHMEIALKPGQHVKKTVDCFTFGGFMKLYNTDLAKLVADYERVRSLEVAGLFVFAH